MFHAEGCLCIADDDEREAMGVAALSLLGEVNGEKEHAAEVLRHAEETGVARTWPAVPDLRGTET